MLELYINRHLLLERYTFKIEISKTSIFILPFQNNDTVLFSLVINMLGIMVDYLTKTQKKQIANERRNNAMNRKPGSK